MPIYKVLPPEAIAALIEHGWLLGLLDDDHPGYLWLAGRSGQSIDDDIDITGTLGVGIVTPEGKVHIIGPDGVAGGAIPNVGADDLVVENNDNCGISIKAANDKSSNVYFTDPNLAYSFQMSYSHAAKVMQFLCRESGGYILFATNTLDDVLKLDAAQKGWFYGALDVVGPVNLQSPTLTTPDDLELTCGANKTLELQQPVYDDQQVNLGAVGFGASAPAWTAYKGGEILSFANNQSNEITFIIQYSHKYKQGTDLDLHLHTVAPDNNAGNVRWQLTVSAADIGSDFPAETTTTVTQSIAANSQDNHQLFEISGNIGSFSGVSGILICSVTRLGSDGADTYNNSIGLIALDSHFQIDTIGSRQEAVK